MRKTRSYRIKRHAMTHCNRFGGGKRGDSLNTNSGNISKCDDSELQHREMSLDCPKSTINDRKYPMTIENKKVNFEKKKYDCKVIKISE